MMDSITWKWRDSAREGRYYRVLAKMSVSIGERSFMTLEYSLGRIRVRRARSNLSKLGFVLDELALPCSVICSADGDLPSKEFRPIVGLPFLQFNMPYEFFDEIRGVRLAKLNDGVESDSVAIDIYEDDNFHIHAQTSYNTELSSSLPSEALVRLTDLKSHAVTEVQRDDPEES